MTEDRISIRRNVEAWIDNNSLQVPPDEWFEEVIREQCALDDRFTNENGDWLVDDLFSDERVKSIWDDGKYYAESLVAELLEGRYDDDL